MSRAFREILMVLAVAVGGLLLAGALALTPWHPAFHHAPTVVEVHPPR